MKTRFAQLGLALALLASACGDSTASNEEVVLEDHLPLVLEASYDDYDRLQDPAIVHWRASGFSTTGAIGVCFNDDNSDGLHDHTDTAALFSNHSVFFEGEWVEVSSSPATLEEPELLVDFLNRIADEFGSGPIGLNYVLLPTMTYGFGTGDDPTPALGQIDQMAGSGGADKKLLVVDSGLPIDHPEGTQITGQKSALDPADRAYPHGLMVASAANQILPEAPIFVANAAGEDGRITIASATLAIQEAGSDFDAIILSLGTYGCGAETIDYFAQEGLSYQNEASRVEDQPQVIDGNAIETLVEISLENGEVIVAAAGNDSTGQPFWPAAHEQVFGVGATDASILNTQECIDPSTGVYVWSRPTDECRPAQGLAQFSNRGNNAREEAPGVDIIVEYPLTPHTYVYEGGSTAELTRWVRVSGTSLAAPIWAACTLPEQTPAEICR